MNNLVVKEVEFNNDVLMAAQEKESEKVYVAVTWVCDGIGLNENQRDRQVKNVQSDIVLSKGVKNLSVKFDGQVRNVVAVELDFLPLWLAKISITPKMKENNPFMVQKLVEYQLKAKDVLAEAFIKNNQLTNGLDAVQAMLDNLREQQQDLNLVKLQAEQTNSKVTQIQNHLIESPDRKTIQREINTYARRNEMKVQDVRTMIYNKIEDLHGIDVMKRVTNARKKLQDERVKEGKKPYAKSTLRQKVNGMDIIAELDLMGEVMKILAGVQ